METTYGCITPMELVEKYSKEKYSDTLEIKIR
jgi:hypothetical protein